MKVLFLLVFVLTFQSVVAQVNVGREYGNPTMPRVVSHLPKANQAMLLRATSPRHIFLTKIICFKRICRVQIGRQKALHSISFHKFQKKIKKRAKQNARKKKTMPDSLARPRPTPPVKAKPKPAADTVKLPKVIAPGAPAIKADSVIVLGGELLFETNSSTLMSEHFATLNSIAEYLLLRPTLVVKVSGHTDNAGTEKHNINLSTRRADVVAEYLVDNGVSIDRVSSEGLGSSKPIAPNSTDEGRKKNRRVELLIHDGRR